MNTTTDEDSFGTLLMDDPGDDDSMDSKDKDNPPIDDDPLHSNKVNLDGNSANVNPDSRVFNTTNQLASSDTKASHLSTLIANKAPLNKLAGEVMNTTTDEDSFGTLLMDDPGDGEDNPRFWWAGADHANYISLSTDITNAFNQITQETISETMTSHFGLGIHASVQVVPRSHIPSTQAHIAGLWLTGLDGALRSYVHGCGG